MNEIETTIQDQLAEKFAPDDIEWRIGQAFGKNASVLAYITARGIMSRLDSIFGIMGWKDQYDILDKGVLCRLSVCIDGVWITKEDVAPYSHIEAFKGGVSDALKRAGVKFGIGRYLYDLPNTYVNLMKEKPNTAGYKTHKDKQNEMWYWFPPELPGRAVPGGAEKMQAAIELAKIKEETIHILQEMMKHGVFYTKKEQIINDIYPALKVPAADSVAVMVNACADASLLADFHAYLHKALNTSIAEYMVELSADPSGKYHSPTHQKNSFKDHLKAASPEKCDSIALKLEYAIFLKDQLTPAKQPEAV